MQRHFGQIRTCEMLEMFTKLWYNKLRKAVIQFDQYSTYEKVFGNPSYSTAP